MHTSTRIELGLYDVTAKGDSRPTCADAQPWANTKRDLKAEKLPKLHKYGTLENRRFLMDGSFELWPENPEKMFWGLWSQQQSGTDGLFENPPILEVDFGTPHSSAGITLHFYEPTEEWASEVLIQWYGSSGALLHSAQFAPDAADYYCKTKVENYSRLSITFLGTNYAGRYLKLSGIDYGAALSFEGDQVVEASVLEEIDPLSAEISINTLQMKLYSENAAFYSLNPEGLHDVLQQKQKVTVWMDIQSDLLGADRTGHNIGTFYLSDWNNPSAVMAEFEAVDAMGLLNTDPWEGTIVDTTAGELTAQILKGYAYELSPVYAAERVQGYLPAGSRRDALQQLAFALGAVVDCSRGEEIRIYPLPQRPSSLIGPDRKFTNGRIRMRPLVTGVVVTAHQYRLGASAEELYKNTLAAGTHRISFGEPVQVDNVSGAELLDSGCSYAEISVRGTEEVVIVGRKYTDSQTVIRKRAANLPPNVQANELEVRSATLVSPNRAVAVADRLLEQAINRWEQTFRMNAGEEILADMLIVTGDGDPMRGIIQSMNVDLTGGYLADVKVVGRRMDATAAAYTGEIHTGERSLI